MNARSIWMLIGGLLLGLVAGFLLANAMNRDELQTLRAENEQLKASAGKNSKADQNQDTLTVEEIDRRIAEAEKNSSDFDFQKKLGIALYQYASMKQDADLLAKAIPVLERARRINGSDKDVLSSLGHAHFDQGYFTNNNEAFLRARSLYETVLKIDPSNADIRTDLGLTYFLQSPPEMEKAIAVFNESLRSSPNHEKTLQLITEAYIRSGKTDEGAAYLERLRSANSSNPSIPQLSALINQNRTTQ